MKKRSFIQEILFYLVILVAIVVVLSLLFKGGSGQEKLTYDDVLNLFYNKQVTQVVISEDNLLTMTVVENGTPRTVEYQLRSFDIFYYDLSEIISEQVKDGTITQYEPQPANRIPVWFSWLPLIFVVVIIVVLYFISMRQFNGKGGGKFNSFGKARVKVPNGNDKNRVLFRDVAGADEEKEELVEIVEFLKDPAKFTKLGAKIPHGVLLKGPPGTG
ncbi:MAG: ATP-dependent metallopeptidase FtsH/Yme1/Tma family protein, partial [Clostridia bacterium]|nr:ATP-dependent metallopeptidase FtsH/Yme1/Tma family protein [Clostridia bacterium]